MEAEAIRKATVACISSGVNKVEVESDAMAIIQMIRGERRADMEEVAIVFYMQVLATEFQQQLLLQGLRYPHEGSQSFCRRTFIGDVLQRRIQSTDMLYGTFES
ncbi:hypothetical protein GBA52_007583 [Prunus armeniaca]|nr:hypothetical protein GBA52_007583 [Prunus armeniaca]